MLFVTLWMAFVGQLFAHKVYVTDIEAQDIYVIDTTTNAVIATVANSFTPFMSLEDLAVTPDQQTVYATDSSTVYVISTATEAVTTTVANTTMNPFDSLRGVVITPDGQTAYVAGFNGNVYVIDVPSNTTLGVLPLMNLVNPYHLAISSDGQFLYLTDPGSGRLTIVNGMSVSQQTSPPLAPASVAVTESSIYVTDFVAAVYVGAEGMLNPSLTNVTGATFMNPNWVAATPNGQFVYVSDPNSSAIHIISTTSNMVIGTVGPPPDQMSFGDPQGIVFTPDGEFGYVADSSLEAVYVFSTATNEVVATVSTTGFAPFISPFAVDIATEASPGALERAFRRPNNRRL